MYRPCGPYSCGNRLHWTTEFGRENDQLDHLKLKLQFHTRHGVGVISICSWLCCKKYCMCKTCQGRLLDSFLCMDWWCVSRPRWIPWWALRFILFYSPKSWCQVFILISKLVCQTFTINVPCLPLPSPRQKKNNHCSRFLINWKQRLCQNFWGGGETRGIAKQGGHEN